MLPKNAVHVKCMEAEDIANELKLSYAKALVGYKHKGKNISPIYDGIVVHEQNAEIIIEKSESKRLEKEKNDINRLWRNFAINVEKWNQIKKNFG